MEPPKASAPRRAARYWLSFLALVGVSVALAGAFVARRLGLHPLRKLRAYAVQAQAAQPEPVGPVRWPDPLEVSEWIYQKGRKPAWNDWGWSKHDDVADGPARVQLAQWGGVRWVRSELRGDFSGLTFRYRTVGAPGHVLRVHLGDSHDSPYPEIVVQQGHERARPDGFADVFVPMEQLNPEQLDFTQVVFMAAQPLDTTWLELDEVGLVKAPPRAAEAPAVERAVSWEVSCSAQAKAISPWIYGIGAAHDQKGDDEWWLHATIRRWGGNPTSRYNWRLGNAWNAASDWYFENLDYVGTQGYSYRDFFSANQAHEMRTALTVPLLGWVAKDTTSVSYPRSRWPKQNRFDDYRPEAGDGMRDGAQLTAGPPTSTSVAAPPEFVREWVETIAGEDKQAGRRSVHQYILDNEPSLWSSTHRDVHPQRLGYDELLERTLAYGAAVRKADPEAVIAGPAEWGWPSYFRSDQDQSSPHRIPWDQLRHGLVPLVPWYLKQLAEHERKTGVRLLNLLDLHFYPQADRVHSEASDRATSALRIRSTRGLWDPTYVDESWIGEAIALLPRMRGWIEESYPGCGISIGEWSFGGERHMSGALATAETLGRFGTEGVTSAFYWAFPPKGSPAAWAFRAFRNFDGQGGRALDWSVPARLRSGADTSVFVTRDSSSKHWVFILLNFDPKSAAKLTIATNPCVGAAAQGRVLLYAGQERGFEPGQLESTAGNHAVLLPPYSIGVMEIVAP